MAPPRPKPPARLSIDGQNYELPIITGTNGHRAIDIRSLHAQTGCITLDSGYMNTGSCMSAISSQDGIIGNLDYRGYAVADLAEHCQFIEVAYLLLYGELPHKKQQQDFQRALSEVPFAQQKFFDFFTNFPKKASPLSVVAAMLGSLSVFSAEDESEIEPYHEMSCTALRLLSAMRHIVAFAYRKTSGASLVIPKPGPDYLESFLKMMFDRADAHYEVRPEITAALNKLFILHADNEQNCSTSTVRLVGSTGGHLYDAISAGMNALRGPLHGGANEDVMALLENISADNQNLTRYIERAKDKNDPFRLSGFGHRVYKTIDPRAKVIKKICIETLAALNRDDPFLDIAQELETRVAGDDYFLSRRLYPNVDLYSGILYRALGIPTNMLIVMFAMARLPGWIAHWNEMRHDPECRIGRPRQIYTGVTQRKITKS